jgi:hypothetical protein
MVFRGEKQDARPEPDQKIRLLPEKEEHRPEPGLGQCFGHGQIHQGREDEEEPDDQEKGPGLEKAPSEKPEIPEGRPDDLAAVVGEQGVFNALTFFESEW